MESSHDRTNAPPSTEPGEASPELNIVVAASDSLLRTSFATACRSRPGTVVTTCNDGFDALAGIIAHSPDIALVSASMRSLSASRLVRIAVAAKSPTKLIVISDERDEVAVGGYFRRGAKGYLLDTQPIHQIHSALEYVADGGRYIPPSLGRSRIEAEIVREEIRIPAVGIPDNTRLRYRAAGRLIIPLRHRAVKVG